MERSLIQRALSRFAAPLMDRMILRSLRGHFRAVYLREEERPDPQRPTVLFGNHFYWWDGYLGNLLRMRWQTNALAWMEDWRAFPPFGALGAMPFPPGQPQKRSKTVRDTLRRLQSLNETLFLFPEGALHTGEQLLPFQRSLYWLHSHITNLQILPWAIWIDSQVHQYPEVFMRVGKAFVCDAVFETEWLEEARRTLNALLQELKQSTLQHPFPEDAYFERILEGRESVHERWYAKWGKPK